MEIKLMIILNKSFFQVYLFIFNLLDTESASASHQRGRGLVPLLNILPHQILLPKHQHHLSPNLEQALLSWTTLTSYQSLQILFQNKQPNHPRQHRLFDQPIRIGSFMKNLSSEVEAAKTMPPINYSNMIRQNDLNDVFD